MQSSNVKYISGHTVSIEKLRTSLRPLLVESGILVQSEGLYRFDVAKSIGFTTGGTTFNNVDEAVDFILVHWFPNAYSKAA